MFKWENEYFAATGISPLHGTWGNCLGYKKWQINPIENVRRGRLL